MSMLASVLYIPHGGGPLPILGDNGHANLISFLRSVASSVAKPDAIVVVSAHRELPVPTVTGSANPSLVYDYYGFPQEAYEISYAAPGNPSLAASIKDQLRQTGFDTTINAELGFDHGVFVPLKLMYPDADIPVVQLSLLRGLDPQAHVDLGAGLAHLRGENVMVLGSGFSFHNLRAFMNEGLLPQKENDLFQEWLIELMTGEMSENERSAELIRWDSAPNARLVHPREEHLIPLHVCYGAARSSGTAAELVFDDLTMGRRAVGFLWS